MKPSAISSPRVSVQDAPATHRGVRPLVRLLGRRAVRLLPSKGRSPSRRGRCDRRARGTPAFRRRPGPAGRRGPPRAAAPVVGTGPGPPDRAGAGRDQSPEPARETDRRRAGVHPQRRGRDRRARGRPGAVARAGGAGGRGCGGGEGRAGRPRRRPVRDGPGRGDPGRRALARAPDPDPRWSTRSSFESGPAGEPDAHWHEPAAVPGVAVVLADPRGLRRIIGQHNRWRTVWSADDVLDACYALSLAHLAPPRAALLADGFPARVPPAARVPELPAVGHDPAGTAAAGADRRRGTRAPAIAGAGVGGLPAAAADPAGAVGAGRGAEPARHGRRGGRGVRRAGLPRLLTCHDHFASTRPSAPFPRGVSWAPPGRCERGSRCRAPCPWFCWPSSRAPPSPAASWPTNWPSGSGTQPPGTAAAAPVAPARGPHPAGRAPGGRARHDGRLQPREVPALGQGRRRLRHPRAGPQARRQGRLRGLPVRRQVRHLGQRLRRRDLDEGVRCGHRPHGAAGAGLGERREGVDDRNAASSSPTTWSGRSCTRSPTTSTSRRATRRRTSGNRRWCPTGAPTPPTGSW